MKVTEDLRLSSRQADVIADVQRAMANCEEEGVSFRALGVEVSGELRAAIVRESTQQSLYPDYILRGATE